MSSYRYMIAFIAFCGLVDISCGIPSSWKPPLIRWDNQPLRSMPVVQNFIGSANLIGPQRLVETGIIGLGPITMAPYNGNFQNSTLLINGSPSRVANTSWSPCEGIREGSSATNAVRMVYQQRVVMQRWKYQAPADSNISLFLDGPYFRRCDNPAGASSPCGWGIALPIDRENFNRSIVPLRLGAATLPVMITSDTVTPAATAAVLIGCDVALRIGARDNFPGSATSLYYQYGFLATARTTAGRAAEPTGIREPSGSPDCDTMWHVMAVGANVTEAVDTLHGVLARYGANATASLAVAFALSCDAWTSHWASAFTAAPSATAGPSASSAGPSAARAAARPFTGQLPTLQCSAPSSTGEKLEKLYVWAATALISLQRIGYPSTPSGVTVISEGPSNSFSGGNDMGGAGQFVWDLSFSAVTNTLLDPVGTKRVLTHIIANANFKNALIGVPQSWDAWLPFPNTVFPGIYCFDFLASFLFFQAYLTTTGDYNFLHQGIYNNHDKQRYTPLQFLHRVAWAWLNYPRSLQSIYLVDYGDNKRDFLEAALTYKGVVPALQAGNAGMLFSLADLVELAAERNTTAVRNVLGVDLKESIAAMRGNATAILRDLVRYSYVQDGSWRCLSANSSIAPVDVRAIADTIYIGLSVGLLGRAHAKSLLPLSVRDSMKELFQRELLGNGWVRALSLLDGSMKDVMCAPGNCSVETLVGMRTDWTATGGYGGLAGAAVDALADITGELGASIDLLLNLSLVSDEHRGTMPGQGIAVLTPPYVTHFLNNNDGVPVPSQAFAAAFPEWFDEPQFPPLWPHSMRSIQNAEASIVDAIIRSVFGWRPGWFARNVSDALFLPHAPRPGINCTLFNLTTPFGKMIHIRASESGLLWSYSV